MAKSWVKFSLWSLELSALSVKMHFQKGQPQKNGEQIVTVPFSFHCWVMYIVFQIIMYKVCTVGSGQYLCWAGEKGSMLQEYEECENWKSGKKTVLPILRSPVWEHRYGTEHNQMCGKTSKQHRSDWTVLKRKESHIILNFDTELQKRKGQTTCRVSVEPLGLFLVPKQAACRMVWWLVAVAA